MRWNSVLGESLFLTRFLLSMFIVFFNDTATTEIYTLSLRDALPILIVRTTQFRASKTDEINQVSGFISRSEEHTSELQSQSNLVGRLLLEKKIRPHALRRRRGPVATPRHGRAGLGSV